MHTISNTVLCLFTNLFWMLILEMKMHWCGAIDLANQPTKSQYLLATMLCPFRCKGVIFRAYHLTLFYCLSNGNMEIQFMQYWHFSCNLSFVVEPLKWPSSYIPKVCNRGIFYCNLQKVWSSAVEFVLSKIWMDWGVMLFLNHCIFLSAA